MRFAEKEINNERKKVLNTHKTIDILIQLSKEQQITKGKNMCCSIQELEVQPYELVNVDLKSGTSNMARRLSYLLYNLLSNMPVIIR